MNFYIDVCNSCNLRCRCCPTGCGRTPKLETMPASLFSCILKKIGQEFPGRNVAINLFNWAEPFLHPDLAELVARTRQSGFTSAISSNFNHVPNLEKVIAARPDFLYVSVSGFSQEIYARAHAGGDVERVKKNIALAAGLIREMASRTQLHILFHDYVDNAEDCALFEQFATQHGAAFSHYDAHFSSAERLREILTGAPLSENEAFTLQRLKVSPFDVMQKQDRQRSQCPLRTNSIPINHKGEVQLCCATTDRTAPVGTFDEDSFEHLQARRMTHPFCESCMGLNIPSFYSK